MRLDKLSERPNTCATPAAVTVRTPHGHEDHGALLLKSSAARHTWGKVHLCNISPFSRLSIANLLTARDTA